MILAYKTNNFTKLIKNKPKQADSQFHFRKQQVSGLSTNIVQMQSRKFYPWIEAPYIEMWAYCSIFKTFFNVVHKNKSIVSGQRLGIAGYQDSGHAFRLANYEFRLPHLHMFCAIYSVPIHVLWWNESFLYLECQSYGTNLFKKTVFLYD